MHVAELGQGVGRRQRPGNPHFEAVCEEHDLHAAGAGVVPVSHGVDDGLRHYLPRGLELAEFLEQRRTGLGLPSPIYFG